MEQAIILKGYKRPLLAAVQYLEKEFTGLSLKDDHVVFETDEGLYGVAGKEVENPIAELKSILEKKVTSIGTLEYVITKEKTAYFGVERKQIDFKGSKEGTIYNITVKKKLWRRALIKIRPEGA